MINVNSRISIINNLVVEGTEQSLTYAALECRLTIELICYERLLASYDYISYKDLKSWTPRHVVQQIVEEANEHASTEFTISISDTPTEEENAPKTRQDFEKFNYAEIGTQSGFSIKKLGILWQALSKIALHINMPKEKSEKLKVYSDTKKLKEKIQETINELRKIGEGNIICSGFEKSYSFACISCGIALKRTASLLKNKQVVNCLSPTCDESYEIHKEEEKILYSRRITNVSCDSCAKENQIATGILEKLSIRKPLNISCNNCNQPIIIELIPCKKVFKKGNDL